jgi:hypothetical protein
LATAKSKGDESPVRLAGDCNPWMSKMKLMGEYEFSWDGNNFPVNSGYSGFELCNFWHGPVLIGTSLKVFC